MDQHRHVAEIVEHLAQGVDDTLGVVRRSRRNLGDPVGVAGVVDHDQVCKCSTDVYSNSKLVILNNIHHALIPLPSISIALLLGFVPFLNAAAVWVDGPIRPPLLLGVESPSSQNEHRVLFLVNKDKTTGSACSFRVAFLFLAADAARRAEESRY